MSKFRSRCSTRFLLPLFKSFICFHTKHVYDICLTAETGEGNHEEEEEEKELTQPKIKLAMWVCIRNSIGKSFFNLV